VNIPLNRVVAFFGPYITLVAAAAATWLIAKLNVLGFPGLDEANTATFLAGAITFVLTGLLGHLGQMKWLKGAHIELANDGKITAAAIAKPSAPPVLLGEPVQLAAGALAPGSEPVVGATYMGNGEWLAPGAPGAGEADEELPSDEVEFASPPVEARPGDARPEGEHEDPPQVGG
jgi:hypothetical protein